MNRPVSFFRYSLAQHAAHTALRMVLFFVFVSFHAIVFAQRKKEKMPDIMDINALIIEGKSSEALAKLDEWILQQPSNTVALSVRAELLVSLEQLTRAQDDFLRLTTLLPDKPDYFFMSAIVAANLGDTTAALSLVEQAMALDEENSRYLDFLGAIHFLQGSYTDAIASYTHVLRLSPSNWSALYMRSLALYHTRQYKQALKDFKRLTPFADEFDDVYFQLARLYYELENYDESMLSIIRHIARQPNDPAGYELRGELLMMDYAYEEAAANFEKARQLGGGLSIQLKLILLYADTEEFERAEEIAAHLLLTHPNEPRIFLYRAIVRAADDRKEESKADFDRFLDLAEGKVPHTELILFKLRFYQENGMEKEASAELKQFAGLEITDDELVFELAQNFYVAQQYEECVAMMDGLIAKHPSSKKYISYRARVHNRMRNYRGAEADFSRAIQLDPENDEYYFSRGLARLRLNKRNEACGDFRKSAAMGNVDAKHALRDECR